MLLTRYQQHSPHRFRWWELPAYGAAFGFYVYLWTAASVLAWFRLMAGRIGWTKTAPRDRRGSGVMKVVTILGTRPEVIKLAPVIAELRRTPDTESVVVSTGQHRELLDQMLEQFEIAPDIDLDVMRPQQRLSRPDCRPRARPGQRPSPRFARTGSSSRATRRRPCAARWRRSTRASRSRTSRPGCAPATIARRFPKRPTGGSSPASPRCTSARPARSAANLHQRSGTRGAGARDREHRHRLAALGGRARPPAAHPPCPRTRPRRILLTLHRRESHGEAMRASARPCAHSPGRGDTEIVFPVHRSPAVRDVVLPELVGCRRRARSASRSTTSPSSTSSTRATSCSPTRAGCRRKAPALGKPVLVLRDTTERPEAIEAGVARLVGTESERDRQRSRDAPGRSGRLRGDGAPENPFGDGHARPADRAARSRSSARSPARRESRTRQPPRTRRDAARCRRRWIPLAVVATIAALVLLPVRQQLTARESRPSFAR